MANGKPLAIVSGIITILGTFLFSWIAYSYVYGIGAILNIAGLFGADGDYLAETIGMASWFKYIILVLVILFLISGILQIIGAKARACSIIGAVLPFMMVLFIMFYSLGLSLTISNVAIEVIMMVFTSSSPLVSILPINYGILNQTEAIGTYILGLGAILAIISAFMEHED